LGPDALDKAGRLLPPNEDYPPKTAAVRQDEWRAEFYQLYGGTDEANKKALQRATKELLANKAITQRNGLVWPVRQKGGA
jgi:hypothetical protein